MWHQHNTATATGESGMLSLCQTQLGLNHPIPFVVFFTVPKTKIGAISTSKFAAVRLVPPYFCGRAIVAAHSSKTMTERSVALWSFLHKRLKGDASHKFHDPEYAITALCAAWHCSRKHFTCHIWFGEPTRGASKGMNAPLKYAAVG